MNPDSPLNPQEQNEARLTALLLGELSGAEAEALWHTIESDSQLFAQYEHLKKTLGFVRDVAANPAPAAEQNLKLSDDRRQKLLAHFKTIPLSEPITAAKTARTSAARWLVTIAAAIVIMAGLAVLLLPSLAKSKNESFALQERFDKLMLMNGTRELADGNKTQLGLKDKTAKNENQKSDETDQAKLFIRFHDQNRDSATAPQDNLAAHKNTQIVLPPAAPAAGEIMDNTINLANTSPGGAGGGGGNSGIPAGNSSASSFVGRYPYTALSNGNGIHDFQTGEFSLQSRDVDKLSNPQVTTESGRASNPIRGLQLTENDSDQRLSDAKIAEILKNIFPHRAPDATTGSVPSNNPLLSRSQTLSADQPRITPQTSFDDASIPTRGENPSIPVAINMVSPPAAAPAPPPASEGMLTAGSRLKNPSSQVTFADVPPVSNHSIAGTGAINYFTFAPSGTSAQKQILSAGAIQSFEKISPASTSGALSYDSTATPTIDPTTGLPINPAATRAPINYALASDISGTLGNLSDSKKSLAKNSQTETLVQTKTESEAILQPNSAAAPAAKSPEDRFSAGEQKIYVVRSGYTLGKIARRNGVTIRSLRTANGISSDLIKVGEQLIVPGALENNDPPAPAAPSAAPIPQPEVQTSSNAFSTFSLNISDVSFKLAAASLQNGALPDPASIRSEEFINAFDYRDPEPPPGVPVAFAWERATDPFAHNRDFLRLSLKTAATGRAPGQPLNLVLVVDNSGSMERADRVAIIHQMLVVLAAQLHSQDTVSVVTFARTPRLWIDGLPGNRAGEITEKISGLTPHGGTDLESALNLACETARHHYIASGLNRVVLLTDGAANLGTVDPDRLKAAAESARQMDIAIDCFGIGWEGYNDDLLEVLARSGGGRYGFINSPAEAATNFARQLAGALDVAANDVKVQVEFNPGRVSSFRQIGYAREQLTREQFRDNTVRAAQVGAAETGTALYTAEVNQYGEGPVATVRCRYRIPGTQTYREQEWTVPYGGPAVSLAQSTPSLRLAATAATFAEWLAQSPYVAGVDPGQLVNFLSGVSTRYGGEDRPQQLEWMLRETKTLSGK